MDRDEMLARLNSLEHSIQTMREYCWMKGEADDWHGVMDAAADLRELLVEKRVLEHYLEIGKVKP